MPSIARPRHLLPPLPGGRTWSIAFLLDDEDDAGAWRLPGRPEPRMRPLPPRPSSWMDAAAGRNGPKASLPVDRAMSWAGTDDSCEKEKPIPFD